MSADADPFGYRERIEAEAVRQIEMLRHTLAERIKRLDEQMEHVQSAGTYRDLAGRKFAYEDVLDLLGPEDAWWTDPEDGSPF